MGWNAYTSAFMSADNVHLSMKGAETLARLVLQNMKALSL